MLVSDINDTFNGNFMYCWRPQRRQSSWTLAEVLTAVNMKTVELVGNIS